MAETEPKAFDRYDRFLVVVAHPDDAEFATGGTIAALTARGKSVVIVQVTSGDKGTTDPDLQPEELAKIREAEEVEAAKRLGVEEVEFLRNTDGALEPDMTLRGQIVRMIRKHKPDVLITHDPFRPYALHPDHRAVGMASLDSVYPTARDPHYFPEHLREGFEPHKTAEIWFFNAEAPDLYVDVTDLFDAKIYALKAHLSQVGDGDEMTPRVRDRLREIARDQPFELAEAYKVVEMRR
jgi:LmbE family N-acetylglucosaminyl deacetylase